MNISSCDRQIKAADLPLEKMAGNAQLSEKDKLTEVSRQFEAILVRQILTESQKTHLSSSSQTGVQGIYQDMITTQLADKISQSGAVGLAGNLEQQLGRQILKHSDTAVLSSSKGAIKGT